MESLKWSSFNIHEYQPFLLLQLLPQRYQHNVTLPLSPGPIKVKQGAGDRGITAENMEKSPHTDFNKATTNESASVACSNVRL